MLDELVSAYGDRLFVAAVGVGLALLGLVVVLWIWRHRAPSPFVRGGKNRQPRLQVLDAAAIDARRRIVLIRRDNIEHLVMIGGPTDLVIESGIGDERPMISMQHATPQALGMPQQPSLAPVAATPLPDASTSALSGPLSTRSSVDLNTPSEPMVVTAPATVNMDPAPIVAKEPIPVAARPTPVPAPASTQPRAETPPQPKPQAPIQPAPVKAPDIVAKPAPAPVVAPPAAVAPPVAPAIVAAATVAEPTPPAPKPAPLEPQPVKTAEPSPDASAPAKSDAGSLDDIFDAARERVLPRQAEEASAAKVIPPVAPQPAPAAQQSAPVQVTPDVEPPRPAPAPTPAPTPAAKSPERTEPTLDQDDNSFERFLESEMTSHLEAVKTARPAPTVLPPSVASPAQALTAASIFGTAEHSAPRILGVTDERSDRPAALQSPKNPAPAPSSSTRAPEPRAPEPRVDDAKAPEPKAGPSADEPDLQNEIARIFGEMTASRKD